MGPPRQAVPRIETGLFILPSRQVLRKTSKTAIAGASLAAAVPWHPSNGWAVTGRTLCPSERGQIFQ